MGATLFRNEQTEKLADATCTYNDNACKTYEWQNTMKCNPSYLVWQKEEHAGAAAGRHSRQTGGQISLMYRGYVQM